MGEPVDDITISRHSGLTGLRSVVVMSTDLENWTEIEKCQGTMAMLTGRMGK